MPSRTLPEVEAENRLLRKEHRKMRWRMESAIQHIQDGLSRVGEYAEEGDGTPATPPTRT